MSNTACPKPINGSKFKVFPKAVCMSDLNAATTREILLKLLRCPDPPVTSINPFSDDGIVYDCCGYRILN